MALKSNISDYEIQFRWLSEADKKSPKCYNNRKIKEKMVTFPYFMDGSVTQNKSGNGENKEIIRGGQLSCSKKSTIIIIMAVRFFSSGA